MPSQIQGQKITLLNDNSINNDIHNYYNLKRSRNPLILDPLEFDMCQLPKVAVQVTVNEFDSITYHLRTSITA
jgi:hypothetical protein